MNLTFNLEPVYGILLAFAVFNENEFLSRWFYLGFGLIAFALLVHIFILIRQENKIIQSGAE